MTVDSTDGGSFGHEIQTGGLKPLFGAAPGDIRIGCACCGRAKYYRQSNIKNMRTPYLCIKCTRRGQHMARK